MSYSYARAYKYNRSNFEKSKETDGFKGWRKAQYHAQDGYCAWCYQKTGYKDMDVDHIIPLAQSGYGHDLNNFDNLVLACHECNRDIKKDSTYNEVAYNKTLSGMTKQQKQAGFAPEKIYWERPKWIGPNKYSTEYHNYKPENVPEHERNVWTHEAPLVQNYSLKTSDIEYAKNILSEKIDENADTIWNIIKWVAIGVVVILILFALSQIPAAKNSTTKKYCDFDCQEAARSRYEAEEEKRIQEERQEEYEEARRYWECVNAGGSEFECG